MSKLQSLPSTEASWIDHPQNAKKTSIHELENPHSGSEITVEQFFSLRVLWPKRKEHTDLYKDETAMLFDSTRNDIEGLKKQMEGRDEPWNRYLEALETLKTRKLSRASPFHRKLGVYALALKSQLAVSELKTTTNADGSTKLQISPRYRLRPRAKLQEGQGKASRSPSPASEPSSQSSKPSDPSHASPMTRETVPDLLIGDEQIVNTAAMNFLDALFIHEKRDADWNPERKKFTFESGSVKFQARTDGHFQLTGDKDKRSAAILEVKPRGRIYDPGCRIEMQESAQMVSWIYQEVNSHWYPSESWDKKFRRVLLSQDHKEIYVTIAEYTREYALYLQNERDNGNPGFLTMQVYGPFLTDSESQMSWLGPILRTLLPFAAQSKAAELWPISPSKFSTPPPVRDPLPEERMGRAPVQDESRFRRSKAERSPLAGKGQTRLPSDSSDSSSSSPPPIGKLSLGDNPSKGSARGRHDASASEGEIGEPSTRPPGKADKGKGRQR